MEKRYKGVVVPSITPFNFDFSLDEDSLIGICEYFEKHNVSLLLLGTTGESASVSTAIGRRLVKVVVDNLKGKTDIYACLSSNCLEENISNAKAYIDTGADVIVSMLPCYFPITPEQMFRYYVRLVDSLDFPLMIYNIPSTTNMSIPLEIIERLSHHPNIVGLKDSERNLERINACIKLFKGRNDFSYFTGYAALCASSLRMGADGIIPSTGNFVPGLFRLLYDCAIKRNWDRANQLQAETDHIASIYQQGRTLGESLLALKIMLGELGLCKPVVLPPLTDIDPNEIKWIVASSREIVHKYHLTPQSQLNHYGLKIHRF